jgi:hypothetical protein
MLLYARGLTSGAYAEERRREAIAVSDKRGAEYWSLVEQAVLAMMARTDFRGSGPH